MCVTFRSLHLIHFPVSQALAPGPVSDGSGKISRHQRRRFSRAAARADGALHLHCQNGAHRETCLSFNVSSCTLRELRRVHTPLPLLRKRGTTCHIGGGVRWGGGVQMARQMCGEAM